MDLREDLNALTPRLRRYARALMSGHPGRCDRADDLVHATLLRALASRTIGPHADLVIRLYATLTQLNRDVAAPGKPARALAQSPRAGRAPSSFALSAVRQNRLTMGLMNLPLEDREALLLVALESFSHDEAARILHISRASLLARLTQARRGLDGSWRPWSGAETVRGQAQERPASHLRLVK